MKSNIRFGHVSLAPTLITRVKRLSPRKASRAAVRFAPPRSAAVQNVGSLQQCARLIECASYRNAIAVFVAAREHNLRARHHDFKLHALQAIRVEGGTADEVSARVWINHNRHREGRNI